MKKVGIWQPYTFPYLGYFQLIALCDEFVLFDDVNFIKKGFIHRNRLHAKSGDVSFSIPLSKPSQNKQINEIHLSNEAEDWKEKFTKTLHHLYGKKPSFEPVMAMVQHSFEFERISEVAESSIRQVCEYLGIKVDIVRSSELEYQREADVNHKILSLVRAVGGDAYLNPIGGQDLYDRTVFEQEGIEFQFHAMDRERLLDHFGHHAFTYSILHLLFTEPKEKIKAALDFCSTA